MLSIQSYGNAALKLLENGYTPIPVILTPNICCITLINCPLTISSKPEKQPLINFFK